MNTMSKVITFSTKFPSYHPRKGEPTLFVEKIYKSLYLMKAVPEELYNVFDFSIMNNDAISPKHHTIRAGKRWKVSDKFSPRIWSGKPYHSKQIIIAEDIEIKKVWDIEIDINGVIAINGFYSEIEDDVEVISANDGLDPFDFMWWFNKLPFNGQIICWNEQIEY